jgi:hypothetical protein
MQYFKPLITLDFWFNVSPPPFVKPVFIGLGILLAVFLVEGVLVKWAAFKKRGNPPLYRILARLGRADLYIAFLGGFLYFVAYEQIRFISMRFWWLLLAAGAIYWKTLILRDRLKRYPLEKRAFAERVAKEKYLPK